MFDDEDDEVELGVVIEQVDDDDEVVDDELYIVVTSLFNERTK